MRTCGANVETRSALFIALACKPCENEAASPAQEQIRVAKGVSACVSVYMCLGFWWFSGGCRR